MPPEVANSPLGNFPELAKSYASSFQVMGNQTRQAGDSFNTGVQVQRDEAARKAELESRAQKLQDMTDPSKYEIKQKDDGGYDFFDPEGKQIDIATFSQRTGANQADIIADSQNPIDIQFRNDYSNLQTFMDAVVSKDKGTIDSFIAAEPGLKKFTKGRGGLNQLLEQFKKSYERYYTPRSVDPQAWGRSPGEAVLPTPQTGASAFGVSGGGQI